MTNAFETTRERVRNSASSIFTKTDVLQLLHDIEDLQKSETKEELPNLDKIFEMVTEEVNSVLGNFQFDDITSVDLCDREITLDYDISPLMEDIETAIDNLKSQLTEK
jgi:molecular chaperone GrpE (heat shock protein)